MPYQELLFPGGSMDTVLPVYKDGVVASFYNECVVAAVRAIVDALPEGRLLRVLEIGAGTGGTAASVLPALRHACSCYTFTDVSESFLRAASKIFAADYPFVEYELLNIDADPRLQGIASAQYDLIISTNCLHATPFMRNTLRNCHQLLAPGGLLLINDAQPTSAFVQITFGLTDGWWLFHELGDPERVGYHSPLMEWEQWRGLLEESRFRQTVCMRGAGFLQVQAVMVAQKGGAVTSAESLTRIGRENGAHLFTGGLGGLGLLTARVLVKEAGATRLLMSSRSGQVQRGSEADWEWLAASGATVRCVRSDASDASEIRWLMHSLSGDNWRLGGIFHAAGVLADALLAGQSAQRFCTVYGPKVHGGVALHRAAARSPVSTFLVYSSAASLLGSAGQAPHSAANSWLDAFAYWRRSICGVGQGLQWGAVAEIGYAARHGADTRAERSGSGAATRAMAYEALSCALSSHWRLAAVLPIDWPKLLGPSGAGVGMTFLTPHRHKGRAAVREERTAAKARLPARDTASNRDSLVSFELLLQLVERTAGGAVDADAPLMEAGLDSLGAVELRNQLQQARPYSHPHPNPNSLT
eukprot:scaffold71841_cov76-Phaeocystis_antarctica.AAC.3